MSLEKAGRIVFPASNLRFSKSTYFNRLRCSSARYFSSRHSRFTYFLLITYYNWWIYLPQDIITKSILTLHILSQGILNQDISLNFAQSTYYILSILAQDILGLRILMLRILNQGVLVIFILALKLCIFQLYVL